jgi:nucleoside-diphosphate-sugar epimerase
MLVAVTGSSGKIGRAAVASIVAAGHKVVGLDLKPVAIEGMHPLICDCGDFGQVMGALSGADIVGKVDAVVHMAALPAPGLATDHVTFNVNTLSTYNVFSAATRLGIKRVVWGSSETVHGVPFATHPVFAPIDESHPDRTEWSYALSKKLGEVMADEFCRWHNDLCIVSLRFSNVFVAEDYGRRAAIDANPAQRTFNLWGYVDARDAGEACQLALQAPLQGHQRFVIAAADTIVSTPSAELMAQHFPDVPIRRPLKGNETLLSIARAAELLGYKPRHSWRNQ